MKLQFPYFGNRNFMTPSLIHLPPKQAKIALKSVFLNKINTVSVVILWLPTFWSSKILWPPIFLFKNVWLPVYLGPPSEENASPLRGSVLWGLQWTSYITIYEDTRVLRSNSGVGVGMQSLRIGLILVLEVVVFQYIWLKYLFFGTVIIWHLLLIFLLKNTRLSIKKKKKKTEVAPQSDRLGS